MLLLVTIYVSFEFDRLNQVIAGGANGTGLGFGWVALRYAFIYSWSAVGMVFLVHLLMTCGDRKPKKSS